MESQTTTVGAPLLSRRSLVRVVLVTLLVALPATALGRIIWPPAMMGAEPTATQLPFFVFESFFEALSLGLGVAFLLFGLPVVRQAGPALKARAWLMYLSIGWFLVSWWPHGNLHVSNGDDMQRLLYIEYGFHVSLIVCGAVLAYCFLSLLRESGRVGATVR